MRWFKHDADALTDAKIKKLIRKYGATGYAVYFHCLELIAGDISETNITFELEHDAEIIADDLRITGDTTKSGVDYVNEIVSYIVNLGLFECSSNRIFCFKMLKRIDSSMLSASSKMRGLIVDAKQNYEKVMTKSCASHAQVMLDYTILDNTRLDYTKPTMQEINEYQQDKCPSVDSNTFFEYYDSNDWQDKNGKPVKNWKLKMLTWHNKNVKSGWLAPVQPKKEYRPSDDPVYAEWLKLQEQREAQE